ncbi:MAG: hypothetical protein JSW25_06135 [Thermoplasmata archaeon]|nr:MAG: hypothetical protein JSW25_06135 [Thermoplasmata archaeon]
MVEKLDMKAFILRVFIPLLLAHVLLGIHLGMMLPENDLLGWGILIIAGIIGIYCVQTLVRYDFGIIPRSDE